MHPSSQLSGVPLGNAKQRLGAQLRSCRPDDDAGLEIDGAFAKRRAVLVGLVHDAQPDPGRLLPDASEEVWSEVLDKALTGAQREGSDEVCEVDGVRRANGFTILHQLTDALAEFERSGRGDETASGPDQQRVAGCLTQSRQRPAHGRRAEP